MIYFGTCAIIVIRCYTTCFVVPNWELSQVQLYSYDRCSGVVGYILTWNLKGTPFVSQRNPLNIVSIAPIHVFACWVAMRQQVSNPSISHTVTSWHSLRACGSSLHHFPSTIRRVSVSVTDLREGCHVTVMAKECRYYRRFRQFAFPICDLDNIGSFFMLSSATFAATFRMSNFECQDHSIVDNDIRKYWPVK